METSIDFLNINYDELDSYIAKEAVRGEKNVYTDTLGYWRFPNKLCIQRLPACCTKEIKHSELLKLLKMNRLIAGTYNAILPPQKNEYTIVFDSFLYGIAKDRYRLECLSYNGRRDARRGLKNFEFREIHGPEFLNIGFEPFSQTRKRIGLDDGTAENFNTRFGNFLLNSNNRIFGAFKDEKLISFISCMLYGSLVEIEGSFSLSEAIYKKDCPNDGLMAWFLDFCFTKMSINFVSIGLSSINNSEDENGLNSFKCKVGFEAIPIKRIFLFNPLFFKLLKSFLSNVFVRVFAFFCPKNKFLLNFSAILKLIRGNCSW